MEAFISLFSQYNVPAAFLVNIELTLWSALFSTILGVILVMMRISPVASLRMVSGAYVELFKNLPLTIIMVFMVLGAYAQLKLSFSDTFATNFFWLAVTGLSLYTAAFVCESLRSGINTVPLHAVRHPDHSASGVPWLRGTAGQHVDRIAEEFHGCGRGFRRHRNLVVDERNDRIPFRRDCSDLPDLRIRLCDSDHSDRHADHVSVQQARGEEVTHHGKR